MHTVDFKDINIGERARPLNEEHAQALAEDIRSKGLLQPIIVNTYESLDLIAGRHRLRAVEIIFQADPAARYKFDGKSWPAYCIPVISVGELTARQMIEYELAENICRLEMTWQERNSALAKIHAGLKEENPEQTVADTGRVLAERGDTRAPSSIEVEIGRAVVLNQHMDNPAIAAAKSASEAWTILRKEVNALSSRAMSAVINAYPIQSPHTFNRGKFQDFEATNVDLVLVDPPYGIGADDWTTKFKNTPHKYIDKWQAAAATMQELFEYAFKRWTHDQANMFCFCSPEKWHLVRDIAEAAGWVTWPRPVVWQKSNEGIRPWGVSGFAYTHEAILFATKGGKGLLRSEADHLQVYKVPNAERKHGAQKPVDLYRRLINLTCNPGDKVMDFSANLFVRFHDCS